MSVGLVRRVPRHEKVTVRGLSHRLTWWGERSASPVVLLHGWMDCGETWQFLVDALPPDWSCVAPDWRGFGGTDWPADGYWFADYFADLEALLDILSPEAPARLIGHSMGGNVASMYAGIRPKRVKWLANVEGIGLKRSSADDAPARYAEWLDQVREPLQPRTFSSVDAVTNFLASRNPAMPRDRAAFLAQAWTKPDGEGADGGADSRVALAFDPRHRKVGAMLFRRDEAEACWRRIEAPVVLFLGGQSDILPRIRPEGSEEYFHSLYRNLRIVTVASAGHMMHIEEPETLARHIAELDAAT